MNTDNKPIPSTSVSGRSRNNKTMMSSSSAAASSATNHSYEVVASNMAAPDVMEKNAARDGDVSSSEMEDDENEQIKKLEAELQQLRRKKGSTQVRKTS